MSFKPHEARQQLLRGLGAIEVRMERQDAHAESSRLEDSGSSLRVGPGSRNEGVGCCDIDRMVCEQHIGAGVISTPDHVGCGVERNEDAVHCGVGVAHGESDVIPAFSIFFRERLEERAL